LPINNFEMIASLKYYLVNFLLGILVMSASMLILILLRDVKKVQAAILNRNKTKFTSLVTLSTKSRLLL
jgi:hypothetical protein